MFVFLKVLCARLFTSAVQFVERTQTVFRHLKDVRAHCFCASLLRTLRDVMPRHALSARAVEEMWRYIALVDT